MTELAVIVGAVSAVILLAAIAKISRQLDAIHLDLSNLHRDFSGQRQVFQGFREQSEAKLDRLLDRLGKPPGSEIGWKG